MKNRLLTFVTHPAFISVIISSIIVYLTYPLFPKYKIELLEKEKRDRSNFYHYCDLDNDGNSERLTFLLGYENKTSIVIDENSGTLDQWNLDGDLISNLVAFGDYDRNGNQEIYTLSVLNNNILLNCIDPYSGKRLIYNRVIDPYFSKNGEKFPTLMYYDLVDLDNDNIKEFVFFLNSGFSESPRRVYSYNFISDSLSKSPESCNVVRFGNTIHSPNYGPLFISSSMAVANCDSNVNYTDHYSWLMVYNRNLNFQFQPIKTGKYPSTLFVHPFRIGEKLHILAVYVDRGTSEAKSIIELFNLEGISLNRVEVNKEHLIDLGNIVSIDEDFTKLFLFYKNGNIESIDESLTLKLIGKTLPNKTGMQYTRDIDLDGENEHIIEHRTQEKISIYRNDFSDPVIIDVPGTRGIEYIDIILKKASVYALYINLGNEFYTYEYNYNNNYRFRHVFYLLIFIGIYLFILILQKTQKYRLQQKINAEHEIAELQMRSIKNQIDPHFTLNIINSIGSLFSKQETEKANYIFGKYSKLLRQTILSSDQILTSLKEELDYVENYLSLEQFRIKNGFDYKINIEEDIDSDIKIPKMLIHSFVENSIKHGIRHSENRGSVTIFVSKNGKSYVIKIIDNGIGREKAKDFSKFSTGKGLEIVDQILELYYTLEKNKITYKTLDLMDDLNNPMGTEVLINIPI